MIFLPNCLDEGPRKFYHGYRNTHGPKTIKDESESQSQTNWTFDAFFKELKNTYIPVNHIHDQMEEWHAIKQSAPGQSKAIKDIAIQIQQLADEIVDGNTIGWKQRIIHLLEAMRPELRLKVEPEVDLSKTKYDQKDYTSIAQIATKHDRILHQLGAYGR